MALRDCQKSCGCNYDNVWQDQSVNHEHLTYGELVMEIVNKTWCHLLENNGQPIRVLLSLYEQKKTKRVREIEYLGANFLYTIAIKLM